MLFTELLIFGSWLFWALVLVYIVGLFVLVENNCGWGSTLLTIGLLAAFQFLFKVEVFDTILTHPYLAVFSFIGYFAVGTGWSVWKWYLFAMERVKRYFDIKTTWLRNQGADPDNPPDGIEEKWVKHLKEDYPSGREAAMLTEPPLVSEHKTDIIRWITYWPISFAWWALHDIVKGIGTAIYNYMASVLQAISDKVYERVRKDLPDVFKK
jgi:hypothetical protein